MVAVFVCCESEVVDDVLSAVLVAVSQVSTAPDSAALDSTMMCSSSNPAVTWVTVAALSPVLFASCLRD